MNKDYFKNDWLRIGSFTIKPEHEDFNQTGVIKNPHIVFPKNSIWIKHWKKDAFVADSNLINLYNKNQAYDRSTIHLEGDYCHWIEIYPQLLEHIAPSTNKPLFSSEYINCTTKIYLNHLEMLSYSQKGKGHIAEERALGIIADILDIHSITPHDTKAQQKKLVQRIKKNINQDLHINISLDDLAQKCYSSPFHISRVFKKHVGIGINRYRTLQRLRLLGYELQKNNTDIAQLAQDFGFSSHSHLSSCFKKYYGITPSKFRFN